MMLVLAPGLPLGYAITRSAPLALVVAPLVTALTGTAAIVIMLLLGGSLRAWLPALFLAQYALLLARHTGALSRWQHRLPHRLRPVWRRQRPERVPTSSPADVAWVTLPIVPPFLDALMPPAMWDSNSIWWLHAAYFTHGADFARAALASPALVFSHPDYPPFASAPVSVVWSVFDGYRLYPAQAVSALVTFSAIALLAYAVRAVTSGAPKLLSRLAGAATGLAAWACAPYAVATGMSDHLWSAAFVAAALLLLIGHGWLDRPAVPVLLLSAVALTKNEGLVMVLVLTAAGTLRYRRELRRVIWPLWAPAAAGLFWGVLARHFGAVSDVTGDPRIGPFLAGDEQVWSRFPPTVAALWGQVGTVTTGALIVAVLGAAVLRGRRRGLGLGSDAWLWGLFALYAVILVTNYLTHANGIEWYLATSADRVSLPFALLACASAACWAVVAASRGRGSGTEHTTADPPADITEPRATEPQATEPHTATRRPRNGHRPPG